jgi:hypothetical protein
MPILGETIATNQKAIDLHATLTESVKAIDDELKSKIETAKAEAVAAMEPLKEQADDYWLELMAGADEEWKIKELNAAKIRADTAFAKVASAEDADMSSIMAAHNELDNALGWVVPKPVDEKVISEVIERDLAMEAAEKSGKLIKG